MGEKPSKPCIALQFNEVHCSDQLYAEMMHNWATFRGCIEIMTGVLGEGSHPLTMHSRQITGIQSQVFFKSEQSFAKNMN